ncbi:helix-turn-helix domain-containing protein [Actinoplanes auranticolor]|uniref:helix-turn-helix domain-containing protein n=1 Tax=Actinoplanes auranticolor TaxID=47988 RepID=UPI001BB341C7|nr:helix-turn-helix transcriptional regulator [Actinoplanes auranticolor]
MGAALARMRRAKGLTGAQLAAQVKMSQPKISRIERGQSVPDPRDVGIIARALGLDEQQARALMDRAERSHDKMTDWRPASMGRVAQQKTLADWESAATTVRSFEPALVPGPLQTSGYAKAVFESFRSIPHVGDDLTESAVLAAVSARVKRQEVLADHSKSFQFLLGEAALKRRIFSPVEMLAQIAHLRETAARHSNVKIAVILDGAPAGLPLQHGFTVIDDKLVVVDLYNTGLTSRSRRDVESYRRVLDILEESATDIEPVLDRYQNLYIDMLQRPRNPQS